MRAGARGWLCQGGMWGREGGGGGGGGGGNLGISDLPKRRN